MQWFFDNLLPEEQARELLAKDAKLPGTDAFALLAYYGRESAGAITLRAPGEAIGPSGLEPLTEADLSERIAKLPKQSVRLAPFYDLVSTESYRAAIGNDPRWPHRNLSTRVGQAQTFDQISLEQYLTFADELGVTRTAANRLVKQFVGGIEADAKQLYEEFEALAVPADARAGQLRVLRGIRRIVIREMVAKLSG